MARMPQLPTTMERHSFIYRMERAELQRRASILGYHLKDNMCKYDAKTCRDIFFENALLEEGYSIIRMKDE